MKKFKKVALLLCALMLLTTLVACSGGDDSNADANNDANTEDNTADDSNANGEAVVLKFAIDKAENTPGGEFCQQIVDEVAANTDGAVIIEPYFSNALGETNLVLQSLVDGSVDFLHAYVDATFVKMTDLFNVGYLVDSYERNAYMLAPGANTYQVLADAFDEIGVELVGIHAEGLTGMSSKSEPDNYNVPGAAKNLMMRVPLSDTTKNCVATMGFQTVSIVWADVYSSIQTGVCDGSSCQTSSLVYTALRDVINYYMPYQQVPEVVEYTMSKSVYDKVTDEQMEIIKAAFLKASAEMAEQAPETEQEYRGLLTEAGVTVLELTDEEIAAFAENERNTNWDVLPDLFGQDVIDGVYADYENC